MAFCSYTKEYTASGYTSLENLFIYEYLPEANGTAVKVYIYGLFLCQNSEFDISPKAFAAALKITEDDVKDAFAYWEEFGLVSVTEEPYAVRYLPHSASARPRKIKPEKYSGFAASLQTIITTRMISTAEYSEYYNIMENYGIKPEAMLMIVNYCIGIKGDSIGYRYISAVARDFGARKILTPEQVENELSSYNLRTAELEKVLKALSSKKKPEIEDLNYYKKWTRELGFEPENVVFAASKLKKGSMKKLDEFMLELFAGKNFSRKEIDNYSKNKQNLYDLAIKINKALSVYCDVLDTVVENYTAKWTSRGYDEKSLLLIANFCFKKGKKTLEDMDEILDSLHKLGLITYESIAEYFIKLSEDDKFLSGLLSAAGVSRRPTAWDRENLRQWKAWNFSEDMIMEAAAMSAGKASPVPYMNAVLGAWKQKGIFTKEQIELIPKRGGNTNNTFAWQHKYSEQEINDIIDNIADIEF